LLLNVRDGDIVIVDANHGVLIVDPDMRLMTQYQLAGDAPQWQTLRAGIDA
jgi:phosphoenolpyruvate-protein kinase (PTS system EI component)